MESNPLVQYRLLGRDGFSAVRKTNTKKEKTSCRSNDKHKIQRRYEGSNICSICHNYGNFCQVTVTLLHKTFVAKYIFIFNRVLCCKHWKKESLLEFTKMGFNTAPFLWILGKFGLFLFLQLSQNALCLQKILYTIYRHTIIDLVERSGCERESTFASRACAPWLIRGRELGFETWELTQPYTSMEFVQKFTLPDFSG